MTNVTQEINKKQVYLNACTRKDQDSSSKTFFYSSTMAEKTSWKLQYNNQAHGAKLGHKRAREQKRKTKEKWESRVPNEKEEALFYREKRRQELLSSFATWNPLSREGGHPHEKGKFAR